MPYRIVLAAALFVVACGGDSDPGTPDACAAAPSCGGVCQTGNSFGVGMYCTKGGGECADTPSRAAPFCTVDSDPDAPAFCTRPCVDNTDCAEDAHCTGEGGMGPKGCVPDICLGPDDFIDAGVPDAAPVDGGAVDAT